MALTNLQLCNSYAIYDVVRLDELNHNKRRYKLLNLPKFAVFFDLECTTWEGAAARNWSGEGEHREIVQVGAAIVDSEHFEELATMKMFVKPKINPVLSKYFTNLTHITQKEVDEKGIDFPDFLRIFRGFCSDLPIYCFDSRVDGSRLFDYDVLMENCELLEISLRLARKRFHNVNELFDRYGYTIKQSGSAPEAFGIKLPARPHDALNDVRGLLVALKALKERL